MMHLSDIFKNTTYGDALFSQTEVSAIEKRIVTREVKGVTTPFTTCLIRNKEIKLTPEEVVRQLYICRLINGYGYPADRIKVEFAVNFGREVKRADIVIMDKLNTTAAYIIVEVKKPKLKDGKEQLKSYTNATGAPIAVWTNGEQVSAYNRKDPNYFEQLTDIPKASERLSDILNERINYDELKRRDKIAKEKRSLRDLIVEIEDEVLANAGVDSFEEVFKLIFSKLYDELVAANDPNYYLQFRNSGDTDSELKAKIDELFKSAKKKWRGIFTESDMILLTPSHLSICVSTLQDVKLFNNNLDVVDDAFEYLMSKSQKGEKGQYFTPRYVIDMCVKMMNPRENENIIDTAAGSSGFPVHSIFHVWRKIRQDMGIPIGEGFTTDKRTERETAFVRDHIFAIDFDEKTVRVARTLNLIAGDGQSNVIHLNTLDYGRWNEVKDGREWRRNYNEGFERLLDIRSDNDGDDYSHFSFDLLMANPPFAGDVKEGTMLSKYELGKNAKGKMQSSVSRHILFIERNLNFLKPGGRMAIVLPQGIFNNSSDKYIRDYIAERCRILAVVGLHGNVFKPHTGTKTSVLFVQKWDDDLCPKTEDYPIFFATMQKPSKDNSGDKNYVWDSEKHEPKLDNHGHLIVDHDLYNHDGLTQDGIAEAFIEFAKRENLSFFADARPFDAEKYAALMSGFECSEVNISTIQIGDFRAEAEFYQKSYLALEHQIKDFDFLSNYVIKIECGPFGSSVLDTEYSQDGLPFIRPLNLVDGIISVDNTVYVSEGTAISNKLKQYPKWTLVLSRVGIYVRFGVVTDSDIVTISSNAIAVVPKQDYVSKFMAIYLRTTQGHMQLYRQQQYSSQPKISTAVISSIRVPKLTDFYIGLTKYFDLALEKIYQSKSAYSSAEQTLLKALNMQNFTPSAEPVAVKTFKNSFGESGRIDAEYYQRKYEDIENALNTKKTVKSLCTIHDGVFIPHQGNYRYIELANVGSSGNITGCTAAPFDELPSRARRIIKKGQVIISSIEGSLSSCALVSDEYDGGICSTGFYVVSSDKINSETLLVLFKSTPIQSLLKKRCSGTILTAISRNAFESMPLPLIDDDAQQTIAGDVKRSFALRRESERLLEAAKRAVEIAIELDETAAMSWLDKEMEGVTLNG
jgi:type I restriction enzyme M protein